MQCGTLLKMFFMAMRKPCRWFSPSLLCSLLPQASTLATSVTRTLPSWPQRHSRTMTTSDGSGTLIGWQLLTTSPIISTTGTTAHWSIKIFKYNYKLGKDYQSLHTNGQTVPYSALCSARNCGGGPGPAKEPLTSWKQHSIFAIFVPKLSELVEIWRSYDKNDFS